MKMEVYLKKKQRSWGKSRAIAGFVVFRQYGNKVVELEEPWDYLGRTIARMVAFARKSLVFLHDYTILVAAFFGELRRRGEPCASAKLLLLQAASLRQERAFLEELKNLLSI